MKFLKFFKTHPHHSNTLNPVEELHSALKQKPMDLEDVEGKFIMANIHSKHDYRRLWHCHKKAANNIERELQAAQTQDNKNCPKVNKLAQAYLFHRFCIEVSAYELLNTESNEVEKIITEIGKQIAHEAILKNCNQDHPIQLTAVQNLYVNNWIWSTIDYDYEVNDVCCGCII